MTSLYHFTDTGRLPWILSSRALKPGANKIGGFPDPDFLWATTDGKGDLTASADRGEHYRSGKVRHVRFTLPADGFLAWREVPARFPEWTAEFVQRLEGAARGKSNPASWWCRPDPLPETACLAIETRSYSDNRWLPFDPSTEVIPLQDHDRVPWLGVPIGTKLFASCMARGPQGQDAFEVRVA